MNLSRYTESWKNYIWTRISDNFLYETFSEKEKTHYWKGITQENKIVNCFNDYKEEQLIIEQLSTWLSKSNYTEKHYNEKHYNATRLA